MDVVLLGTGFPLPDPHRAGPSTLVRAGGMDLLFDAGRGVLMRLAAAGSGPVQLHASFLTHLHSDHVTDFNDVLTMRWAMALIPHPLKVIGPPGTKTFCDATIEMLEPDIGWRLEHHADLTWRPELDIREIDDGVAYEHEGLRVTCAPTHHPPVEPTIGFRIEYGGKSVVIGGDSLPCEGLDRLCDGADVYVQTVLRRSLIEQVPAQRLREILDYHSSTIDAAQTAARAGVKTLVFTHMMPTPMRGAEQEWIDEATPHFDGEIVLGTDLQVISV